MAYNSRIAKVKMANHGEESTRTVSIFLITQDPTVKTVAVWLLLKGLANVLNLGASVLTSLHKSL